MAWLGVGLERLVWGLLGKVAALAVRIPQWPCIYSSHFFSEQGLAKLRVLERGGLASIIG